MIYFPAGADFIWQAEAVLRVYAPRVLMTAYKFVTGQRSAGQMNYVIDGFRDRPMIVDSGMFTVQGHVWPKDGANGLDDPRIKHRTSEWMRRYTDRYVAMLKACKFKGLVVEVDCHYLTREWEKDLDYARTLLRREFGDANVVYVWHPLEPQSVFAGLLKDHDRVAVSEHALRATGLSSRMAISMLRKKLSIAATKHVHVLGCTKFDMLDLSDAFSMDSSTWSMIVRYGRAFPRTPFEVQWYRRKRLYAPQPVMDAVEAKWAECVSVSQSSPMNMKRTRDDDYLRAMACALVSSLQLVDSKAAKLHKEDGDVLWPTARERTNTTARPKSLPAKKKPATSSGARTRKTRKNA